MFSLSGLGPAAALLFGSPWSSASTSGSRPSWGKQMQGPRKIKPVASYECFALGLLQLRRCTCGSNRPWLPGGAEGSSQPPVPLPLLLLVGFFVAPWGLWDPTGPHPLGPSTSCCQQRVSAVSLVPVGFNWNKFSFKFGASGLLAGVWPAPCRSAKGQASPRGPGRASLGARC